MERVSISSIKQLHQFGFERFWSISTQDLIQRKKIAGIGIVKVSVSTSYAPLKSIARVTIWMSFHWSSTYYIAAMTVACTQQWCNLTCQSQSFLPAGLLFLRAVRGPGCVSRFGGSGLAKDGSLAVITIEHILNNSRQQPMGHWHLSTFIDNHWRINVVCNIDMWK